MDSIRLSKIVDSLPSATPFMPPEALERKLGRPFELRLGANESSFGISPKALDVILTRAAEVWKYPDASCHDFKSALAAHLGCSPSNVVVGPGIDGLLGHIAREVLDPGEIVVTSLGSYPTVEYAVTGVGAQLVRVPYGQEAPNLEALSDSVRTQTAKAVYLANPDNPSGAWHEHDRIREFINSLPEGVVVLLDEAYAEFAPRSAPASEWLHDPRVLRLRTFSKLYGMAGMRVAYVFGHAESVEPIDRIRMHFEVNLLAQEAAIAALGDHEHVKHVLAETEAGRGNMESAVQRLDMRALPSATNFIAIDVGSHERAKDLLNELSRRGVFIRMPWAEPLNRCIRVTIGLREEQERFLEILAQAVKDGF